MILSFHPCFVGDKNIICAGRPPGEAELAAIQHVDAVILPQGCSRTLYDMARNHCLHVFPNYDIRFRYPDKLAQIRLFQETGLPHPATHVYAGTKEYGCAAGNPAAALPFDFPFVFKFAWGGEGESVFMIRSTEDLEHVLEKAMLYENSGNTGFLLQEYIPADRTVFVD